MAHHKKLYVIYVPGFGDDPAQGQNLAVKTWAVWGVKPVIVKMLWGKPEPFTVKFDRLVSTIDQLHGTGANVALVGASAGAAAVLSAYDVRKEAIIGCVLIAGKTKGTGYNNTSAYSQFVAKSEAAVQNLTASDRKKTLSIYAKSDRVVPQQDSIIAGAHNKEQNIEGHFNIIAYQLTLGAPGFIKFLRHQVRRRYPQADLDKIM